MIPIKLLTTIDAETLLLTPLPATKFVIERLLPQGLHILAGAPKAGKSWLSLWLCLLVSRGEPVWGFPSTAGTVLYLCLEDSFARIQSRLFQITEDAPPTLHFANLAGNIGGGLEEQIVDFIQQHPDTQLVVIDTLQKVRLPGIAANPYASDYQDLAILKNLADRLHIAILLIHHLRKMGDEDPFNMISGSAGISGATDSNFVLKPKKRGSTQATLYCTGRDIEYQEYLLQFDSEKHIWEMVSDNATAQHPQADPLVELLIGFLKELKTFDGSATQLSEQLEQQTGETILPSVLSKKLVRYAGELSKAGISVVTSRNRDSRLLHIRCDGSDGNDGKIAVLPAADLLSQPSHLSRQ